jgi:YbgC/YbaW family acyl-CoA thioester hydrolase
MVHRTDLQMRFSDTDALGHVNNVSFAAYAETGRVDFLMRIGKSVTSLILANVSIDYRRQVTFGEPIHIETWVESLGRTSIVLGQAIWAAGERAADVRSVAVHFDYETGRSVELTATIREALEPMLRPGGQ